jgi:maltooligosyltrehalose trehalohydrolase
VKIVNACDTKRDAAIRRYPIGAELTPEGAHFRVWAPRSRSVEIVLELEGRHEALRLSAESGGYFSGQTGHATTGSCYYVRLDGVGQHWPDPASRFQPSGPMGSSQIIDPNDFDWHDATWPGVTIDKAVMYEMHVGTFTQAGTWAAAAERIEALAELGVTVIELMPIAEFPGNFGWSYDSTNLFAPTHLYGSPDAMRYFVDSAHQHGLGVILDVVYNHWSKIGEQLITPFSNRYVSPRYKNEWGAPINFDGPDSIPVREYFLANVRHWISEYHIDGMRIDATQAIYDQSQRPIILEMVQTARLSAGNRTVIMIGENEPQECRYLASAEHNGCELDALWNDDFHHAAMVRLTGSREAYYHDYRGSAAEFVAAAKWGYLYQGQHYDWQGKPRGTPTFHLPAKCFINYLQNHDQVANSRMGERLQALTSPGRLRAITTLLLLAPQTPMLFQGQELGSSNPFLYFNDCGEEDAQTVRAGRAKFLAQFRSLAALDGDKRQADPCDRRTFAVCQLDWTGSYHDNHLWLLHRDLIRLRRADPVFSRGADVTLDGAALTADSLVLRFFDDHHDDRLLVVNFAAELRLESMAEPLAAPPLGRRWATLWSSQRPCYGGDGTPPLNTDEDWILSAECAIVLHSIPRVQDD